VVNFLALGLGVLLMDNGPQTSWYTSLNQAPWTPVNWVFGFAWSAIMLCFSFYMTKLSLLYSKLNTKIIILFSIQFFLNFIWNYIFFNQHQVALGLLTIVLLWLLVGYFTFNYLKILKFNTILIAPYLVWLTIATSLNAYILYYN
jgi:tryptophan-rich sensory protein